MPRHRNHWRRLAQAVDVFRLIDHHHHLCRCRCHYSVSTLSSTGNLYCNVSAHFFYAKRNTAVASASSPAKTSNLKTFSFSFFLCLTTGTDDLHEVGASSELEKWTVVKCCCYLLPSPSGLLVLPSRLIEPNSLLLLLLLFLCLPPHELSDRAIKWVNESKTETQMKWNTTAVLQDTKIKLPLALYWARISSTKTQKRGHITSATNSTLSSV